MPTTHRSSAQQKGIALFVVLVMVLLSTLLVLGSAQIARVNEMATGINSDHQRTFEAAEALLRDAERDIQGQGPDGGPCIGSKCRSQGALNAAEGLLSYPNNASERLDLQTALAARAPSCAAGICVPDTIPDQFWTDKTALVAMKNVAAGYGAYTGAADDNNPLLATNQPQRAWYWVELLPYDISTASAGGTAEALAPDAETPYVYRITAIAQGLQAATQTVLQTTLVWKKQRS